MTTQQEQTDLHHRLQEVLGREQAATLMAMLPGRDDLATKDDVSAVRGDLSAVRQELKDDLSAFRQELKDEISAVRQEIKDELSEVRSEVAVLRSEMATRYATKDDLLALKRDFDTSFHAYVRTFVAAQAVTVVGVSGIVFGLTRFL